MSLSSTSPPKGKKMHQCDFCDKLFSTASNMREHRRTHTGEKPFVCRHCGKAFGQSSTLSKHMLVHKTKEKLKSDIRGGGGSLRQVNEQRQEQDMSDLSLSRPAVSSTSQFRTEPSIHPSQTFTKTLQERKQSKMKMEVEFFDNLDWRNSISLLGKPVNTSLQFNSNRDSALTPDSSFNRAKHDELSSFADQKPIITGMFKNRVCEFSALSENSNLQEVKQEALDVKVINFETSSFLTELVLSGNENPIQAKNENLECPPFFIQEAKTTHCDESKAFRTALPQPVISKGVSRDDQWNASLEDTSIIEFDLTSEGEDTLPETQDKFQSNIETFFKCIHCSETFSSLEEHICLAKEAKMFFKCQICQKTFAQYGPFIAHKQSHESRKQFAVGPSTYKAEEYKKCDNITVDNVLKELSDVSKITDGLQSRQAKEASCTEDLLASSFPSQPSRIQSSTQLREEEQSSNDDVIIIEEDIVQAQSGRKDVLENLATSFSFGSNGQSESFLNSIEKNPCSQEANAKKNNIIEILDSNIGNNGNYEVKLREKLSAISTYTNTNQLNNIQVRYFERSNLSTDDVGKPEIRALNSETLPKPNVVEKKIGNVSRPGLEKRLALMTKNLQQFGKKTNPFTCLFCPRNFSTASNMREHMRTHTGEKPFSCELCHKKFAQSSTRSKHMQTHIGYKMSGYHLNGNKFSQTKNYKKHLKKTGKHHENPKSLLHNRLTNIKEKPKIHPTKSSVMKAPCNKSYSSLPPLKKYAFRTYPEQSTNFSFPPKTISNKIPSLTAKLDKRDGTNNDNLQFGYNKEGANRMNVWHEKTDCIVEHNNNQTLKNKMPFPLAARSDSNISVFASSSLESSKTQTGNLLPSTTLTMLPRPKSCHRGAHRLLRNARNYRPFRCTYCPRTFSTSGNMKEHMRTHTGEKPFRCEYCHRRFAQSSTHSKHVQIHVRKQQLNCFFCGRFFSQVALLRSHIVTDHRGVDGNSTRNPNNLPTNLSGSSNLATANKSGTIFSFDPNGPSESLPNSVEKNQCSQEAKVKKNEIIEIPGSNLGNVGNYEINSGLTDKRLATFAKPRIQQQQHHHHHSQIKSVSPSAKHSESSIIELESCKSLSLKDTNLYSEVKPLDSSSSASFRMEEELNNSGEKMVDKIFLNDYSYQKQLINLSDNEILDSPADDKQKRPAKLQIGSPQNIDKGNLMHYDKTLGNSSVELQTKRNTDTDQLSNQYVQSKIGTYNNSFLDKGKKLHPQKVYSPLLKSDQSSPSPSSFSGRFTPPALTNNSSADHFPANTQISTINKLGNEAIYSLSNEQGNNTFEPASHQVKQLPNLCGNIMDPNSIEQNVPPLLNSEHFQNPCIGDATKEHYLLSGIVPKPKSEREEITSDILESFGSKMENSIQEGSVAVLSNGIKLEQNVLGVDTELGHIAKNVQVKNATNPDMTVAVSIGDSLDSSFHFNASNITSNAQYSVATEIDRDKIIADNSGPFRDKGETISLSEAVIDTSLARICAPEPMSVCSDTENQQLPLNGMPPNDVDSSLMVNLENKRCKIVGNFKCTDCNRFFSTRSNMREHMRIHTGEKPFECVFCFRRFAQSSTHSKHVQTHLRFRQLVCPQCGRRFSHANNLCQHIKTHHRIPHTSVTSLAKKMLPRSDPVPPTPQTSSCLIKKSSHNKDKHLYSAGSDENNHGAVNVPEASMEPLHIYKLIKTNNEAVGSSPELSHLPFLDNEQTNKETFNVLPKIPTQLTTSEVETKSTIDIDLEKTNFIFNINFPTPNKTTTESLQDVSFDTLNSNLNQSDLPLNKLCNALTERNNNTEFSSSTSSSPPPSSLPPTFSSLSPLPSTNDCPLSAIEPTKQPKKKSLTLHFHRCLFCSKMFDALINLQEHLTSLSEEEPSLQSKYGRKLRECSTWYRHMEIVLGVKMRLPNQTFVGKAQHLKIIFDVGERLKMLLHRNLYKCRQCRKECATFQSLLFHRRTHLRKLTGQKILTLESGKLNKRARGPSSFLKRRQISSLIFSLETVSSDNGGNLLTVENQQESRRASRPLLCLSLKNQFWLVNLNGTLRALGPYSRCLPVDKSLMTGIGSCKQSYLWNGADSLQQKSNETFKVPCSEEGENADTPKCTFEDKLEQPLHFSLNNLEENDMKIDLNDYDSKKNDEVLQSRRTQSTDVDNSGADIPGVIKLFGQEMTTMVSLELQKCVNCGKMFPHAGHLEKHLQIHADTLPFQCIFCPKSFRNFSTFARHKNLIHLKRNRKSCITRCRKNKTSSNDDRTASGLQDGVEYKYPQTKLQSTLDMNFADVDTAYLADLLKKVLSDKRTEVFSDSPFVHRLPSEESTKLSEMIEYPQILSEKPPKESGINMSGQPFQSQESDTNVCIVENFLAENEINFVEGDDSNKAARGIHASDNFLSEIQVNNENEENFSALNNSKAVDESNMGVKREADIFSHNWPKVNLFTSQSSQNAERQVDSNRDKEAQINHRVGNVSTLVMDTDSNVGFDEKHLIEGAPMECIFINDDPDDRSQDECCIVDVSSSSSQYLPNCNEKTDTTNEIIILSDEENDDSSAQVKMQPFNAENSLSKLCNNTDDDFLVRVKENQIEDRSKADRKCLQNVSKSVAMPFENCKSSSFPEITGQNPNPNLDDGLGKVSTTSSLQISSIASNSTKTDASSKEKLLNPSRSSLTSAKVHPCLYCSKICSSSSNLREHTRSHTGERPFSCGVCQKTFAQKSTLSKHTQIHKRFGKFSPVSITIQEPSRDYDRNSTELTPMNSLNPPLNLVEPSYSANQLKIKHVSNISMDPEHTSFKSSTNWDSHQKSSNIKPIITFENDRLDVMPSSEIISNPSSSSYHQLASGIYPLPQSSANVLTCTPISTKADPVKPGIPEVVPEIGVSNKFYLCDTCNRIFTTFCNFKEHRRTHTGE